MVTVALSPWERLCRAAREAQASARIRTRAYAESVGVSAQGNEQVRKPRLGAALSACSGRAWAAARQVGYRLLPGEWATVMTGGRAWAAARQPRLAESAREGALCVAARFSSSSPDSGRGGVGPHRSLTARLLLAYCSLLELPAPLDPLDHDRGERSLLEQVLSIARFSSRSSRRLEKPSLSLSRPKDRVGGSDLVGGSGTGGTGGRFCLCSCRDPRTESGAAVRTVLGGGPL